MKPVAPRSRSVVLFIACLAVCALSYQIPAEQPPDFRLTRAHLELDRDLRPSRALIAAGNIMHFAGMGLWLTGYGSDAHSFFTGSSVRDRAMSLSPIRAAGGALMVTGPLVASIGSSNAQRSALMRSKDPYTRFHFLDFGKGLAFIALGNFFGYTGTRMAINSGEESVLVVSTSSSLILAGIGEYFLLRSATEPVAYVRIMRDRLSRGDLQFSLSALPVPAGGGVALICRF